MQLFRVYQITNKLDGSVYVGLTTKTAEVRWLNHRAVRNCEDKKHLPLYQAINTFGFSTFSVSTIDTFDTKAEAKQCEEYIINAFRTLTNLNVYNVSGGEGSKGINYSPETRAKISAASKGRVTSDETKAKLRACFAETRFSDDNPNARWSSETIASIRAMRARGATHKEIEKEFGISASYSSRICASRTRSKG